MLRAVYVCLIRLHPPAFRRRFADDMLSIFDQETGRLSAIRLVADAALSLLRQWTIRSQYWHEPQPAAVAAGGALSFPTLDKPGPASRTLFSGIVPSVAVFCIFCLALLYGQNHIAERHGALPIQKYGLRVLSPRFIATLDADTNQNCQSPACLQLEATSGFSTLGLQAQGTANQPPMPQWQINAGGKMAFDVASVKVNNSGSPVTSTNIL